MPAKRSVLPKMRDVDDLLTTSPAAPTMTFSQKLLSQAVSVLRKYEKTEFSKAQEHELAKEIPAMIARLEEAIDRQKTI